MYFHEHALQVYWLLSVVGAGVLGYAIGVYDGAERKRQEFNRALSRMVFRRKCD